ncbi:MAG: TRAP transporter large permease subunit [Thermodesulfobacteriota bacterium]|nr:TRAP transporter large permease subunit [Thermodesulfobacteriota bacterium]
MSPEIIVIITFVLLFVLIALKCPIFASLGIASVVGIFLCRGFVGLTQIPLSIMSQLNNPVLVAAPLYIIMGETIFQTGIGKELYDSFHKWLSGIPGGLAIASVIACAIFGAMCGVSIIAVAVIGVMAVPEMLRRGYDKKIAAGSITGAAALSMLIPPSLVFILYGAVSGVSVGKLFIGGIVPGVFIAILMSVYILLRVIMNPDLAPRSEERITWGDRFSSLKKLWTVIVLIVVVLLSIYTGVCTPTEAGAAGAAVALLIAGFVYKSLSWQAIGTILRNTTRVIGAVLLIAACAFAFGQFLLYTRMPDQLAQFSVSLGFAPILVMLFFMVVLVFMGMFIDGASMVLVTTPIFLPSVIKLGYDPLWYGIILVINLCMAVITPPVGLNLFTMKSIAEDISIEEIIVGTLPYVGINFAALVFFVVFPEAALWLPRLMS